jgi:hypothetical protein
MAPPPSDTPGEQHRQLRSRHVGAMLLDQLGQPQPAVAVAALAADLKAIDPADQVAEQDGAVPRHGR